MILAWLPWWAGAYLVGSIPVGFLLARARGVDIRAHGSGNIGATNVWRVLGPRLGALCFALDVLKGLAPALGAGIADGMLRDAHASAEILAWLGVAAAAIAGHMFPVWLRFKGGKGVATGLGALVGIFPIMTSAAALALLLWIISARLTRYVGISSCIAALSMPLGVLAAWWAIHGSDFRGAWTYLVASVLLAGVVVFKHRGNIRRTFDGTERRIGERVHVTPRDPAGSEGHAA